MINIIKQTFFIFLLLFSADNKSTIELIILILLFYNLIYYLKCLPRITKILNVIENVSCLSCFFTSCFIYFVGKEIGTFLKYFLIILMLFIHISFLLFVFYQLIKAVFRKFHKKIKKYINKIYSMLRRRRTELPKKTKFIQNKNLISTFG